MKSMLISISVTARGYKFPSIKPLQPESLQASEKGSQHENRGIVVKKTVGISRSDIFFCKEFDGICYKL